MELTILDSILGANPDTMTGLALLAGIVVYAAVEVLKGVSGWFRHDAGTGLTRAIAIVAGALFGLAMALTGGSALPWWGGMLSGIIGALIPVAARAIGTRQGGTLPTPGGPGNSSTFSILPLLLALSLLALPVASNLACSDMQRHHEDPDVGAVDAALPLDVPQDAAPVDCEFQCRMNEALQVYAYAFLQGVLDVGVGCSGAQQQVWAKGGEDFGWCLLGCGVERAPDLISDLRGNQTIDLEAIGWERLPCAINCLKGYVYQIIPAYGALAAVSALGFDSVGATMTSTARLAAAAGDLDELEILCGPRTAGPPQCFLLIRGTDEEDK